MNIKWEKILEKTLILFILFLQFIRKTIKNYVGIYKKIEFVDDIVCNSNIVSLDTTNFNVVL